MVANRKRTERIFREEGSSLRKRKRKKTAAAARSIISAHAGPNGKWYMDSVTDSIITGQRFRALAAVDDYPRECPVIVVDISLVRTRVVSVLDRLAESRGWPRAITTDNGPNSPAVVWMSGLIVAA